VPEKLASKVHAGFVVEFRIHHELLLKLGDAVNAVGMHLGSTAGAGRHGAAVAATQKTFIGCLGSSPVASTSIRDKSSREGR